jgi:ferric-dicitrate binding protein FerR (iron transport regulator)
MKGPQKIGRLIFLYIQDSLSYKQAKELKQWRNLSEANEAFFQQETKLDYIRDRMRNNEKNTAMVWEKVKESYPADWVEGAPRKRGIVIQMLRTAAAIVGGILILAGSVVGYEMLLNPATPKNFAMMASVNGERIMMNDFQAGWTAARKDITVKRKRHGELLYLIPDNLKAPKGQSDSLWTSDRWRFEMAMSDGSEIWMNLSSRIGYPANYNNMDSVSYSILGEAFFMIPGNTNKHYEIRTDSFLVQATGAQLDVRSDTSFGGPGVLLVSGNATVRMLHLTGENTESVHLNPGQLARFDQGKIILDDHPDIKAITGWKR